MEGPNAPWCVGSVFFPPQLLTSDRKPLNISIPWSSLTAVGPLIFNPSGNPQRLLSTGQRLQQFETSISTSKQTKSFVEGTATPFIPRDLLQDHILSDSSDNQNSQFYGNLLQGLKCSDGSVVVFFIYGEGGNRIASTIFHQGSSEKWCSIRASLSSQFLDDSEQLDWSVSPSLQHSIQQLSAVWADFSGKEGTGVAIVAARTNYHVYFCTVTIEEDRAQFISMAKSNFQAPTAHVTWSPHVYGRAAVILENGALYLFEIKVSQNSKPSGVVELKPIAALKCPMQRPFAKLSSQSTALRQNQDQEQGHNEPESGVDLQDVAGDATVNVPELEKKWWCCEFGWVPHKMFVANAWEVSIVDFSEHNSAFDFSRKTEVDAKASTSGIDLMVNVGASECSRFCSLKSEKENIVAFGRDSSDGTYEFSVATEYHIILFDIRQPQTPILQWEHAMRQDPPDLLIMCPLSALRTLYGNEKLEEIPDGRVILAVSFRSGDVRVFCYGSGVSNIESPIGSNPKKQKVQGDDWGSATYAWDIPSRLYAPLANVDDWKDILSSSEGLYSHGLSSSEGLYRHGLYVPKSSKGGQNIAGIVLLSENSPQFPFNERKKTFTILQLTGQGELLAQTYTASHELQDPTNASLSSIEDKSDADESVGAQRPRYHELKFEVLPTFLKYIRTGSILNPQHSRYSEEESIVVDDAGCTFNPGPDETSGGASSEWTNQDPRGLNPISEKTLSKAGLETQFKVLIRELSVPLNMYEVARKVLAMGLPERFSQLDSGIPSDLNAHWHRRYKFSSVSPLLSTSALSPEPSDPRRDGEASEATLSNNLNWKTSFQETIPLPLLLEIHNINKTNAGPSPGNGGNCHTNHLQSGHLVHGEYPTDTKDRRGYNDEKYGLTFVDGHMLLLEGSQCVDGLTEQLILKNNTTVISLSEPTEEWQENPNSDGQSDLQILLYTIPEKVVFPSNSRRVDSIPKESFISADKATDIMHMDMSTEEVVWHHVKAKSRTFVEGLCSKFVAGKASFVNQESNPAKQCLEMDPNLCPIKLCFTDTDEELEPGELTAIEDMQANFLQWQQSFSPYRTLD